MSDEHICFTAIPYDGFDALLGTGGISSSGGTTPLLSDKWKERLQLAARIGIVVGVIVGLGLAFGFSIAAIVRHAHHKHHHSHALNVNLVQMPVETPPQTVETPFWGTHQHNPHHHHQDHTTVDRPARRHANKDKVTGGVSQGGFWTTRQDRRSHHSRLRTHGRPNKMTHQQAQYEAFFPLEEDNEEDDFFPMEE